MGNFRNWGRGPVRQEEEMGQMTQTTCQLARKAFGPVSVEEAERGTDMPSAYIHRGAAPQRRKYVIGVKNACKWTCNGTNMLKWTKRDKWPHQREAWMCWRSEHRRESGIK